MLVSVCEREKEEGEERRSTEHTLALVSVCEWEEEGEGRGNRQDEELTYKCMVYVWCAFMDSIDFTECFQSDCQPWHTLRVNNTWHINRTAATLQLDERNLTL